MQGPDVVTALKIICITFNDLKIPYYIGGSVASSFFGRARSTLDIDIVAGVRMIHVGSIVNKVSSIFYVAEESIRGAIETKSAFNLIHLETMVKIDIFIAKDDPFTFSIFKRRRCEQLDENDPETQVYFASPEDVILHKLDWYRQGGGISERQLTDAAGIMNVQGKNLDFDYLNDWARELGLEKLLNDIL